VPKARPKEGRVTASEKPGPVPPHGHCVVCGRSVGAGEALCSTACTEALGDQNRRRRRTSLFIVGFMALLMVFYVIFLLPRINS
jgi:predicted nucleic acid-binding Zn ribbon protein